ncbi:MAG: DUF2298 domain-containing protein [Halioglobus sp.]
MNLFLAYYLVGLFFLVIAFPFGFHTLPHQPDRGWAAARVLGICLAALLHRALASTGLEPWSTVMLATALPLALVAWLAWALRHRLAIIRWFRGSWKTLLGLELVFVCTFAAAAVLTAHDPAIHGTERLMDFAILQATGAAQAFPPVDPWLAGETLNYYWFGHHMAALPGALGGIPTPVLYNLALAGWFAMLVQLGCALLLTTTGSLRQSLLGGLVLGFGGSLYPWLHLGGPDTLDSVLFESARAIPGTITEFPAYSLFTGDLHAHVLLLPAVLCFLLWLQADRAGVPRAIALLVLNLLLVATTLGNPWNLAAMLTLFAVIWALRCTALPWWSCLPTLAMLPLLWPVSGQGVALAWVPYHQTSPLPDFLLQWGVPALLLLGLLESNAARAALRRWWPLFLALAALMAITPAAALCLALSLLLLMGHDRRWSPWVAAAISGLLLLTLPELVYIKDGYPPPYQRMNTVFKFSYAAWPLLVLPAMLGALRLLEPPGRRLTLAFRAALLPLIGALFIYPALALSQRLQHAVPTPWWDGVAALRFAHPGDIALIGWLQQRLQPGDTCLEAPGESYTWSGRVSALTGCATLLGWKNHQALWRGDRVNLEQREADIDTLYQTDSPTEFERLLHQYRIDWIIVGEAEIDRYGPARPVFWATSLELAHGSGDSSIYRARRL